MCEREREAACDRVCVSGRGGGGALTSRMQSTSPAGKTERGREREREREGGGGLQEKRWEEVLCSAVVMAITETGLKKKKRRKKSPPRLPLPPACAVNLLV